ncbi:MAG TPA: hypothetical protein VGD91_15970 [Trebonia sp.]
MSAPRNSRKLVTLAAVLGLMVIAAFGGYAAASSRTPAARLTESASLAGAQASAASRPVTVHACLAGGNLTRVSVTRAARCPARSTPVQWTGQAGAASSPRPDPSSTASAHPSAPASTPPVTSAPPVTSSAPVTTPSTAAASSPARGPACVTSAGGGSCGPYTYAEISGSGVNGGNGTSVIQDIWNQVSGATQTLTAYSPGDWSVAANLPAGNKAVVSYPDTQQIYTRPDNTPNPLAGYASITSSYAETGPAGDLYEAAYDIWANRGSQEIMIWVDNHGQVPAGSVVARVAIDGVGYQVWSTSGPGSVGHPVSLVMDSNQTSGSVNLLDDLKWLESNGYMAAGSGINQIDFGWEICSTGGVPATFTLSQYGIKASCTSGTSCTK